MIKRDTILVARVTDGETCSGECPFLQEMRTHDTRCFLFGPMTSWRDESVIWGDGSKHLRCPACLSTPSAVVLTEEMVEAVKMLYAMADAHEVFRDDPGQELDDFVRAAFPTIFGGGE